MVINLLIKVLEQWIPQFLHHFIPVLWQLDFSDRWSIVVSVKGHHLISVPSSTHQYMNYIQIYQHWNHNIWPKISPFLWSSSPIFYTTPTPGVRGTIIRLTTSSTSSKLRTVSINELTVASLNL